MALNRPTGIGSNWCFFELARHLARKDGFGAELLTDGVFVFICAIACTFYRFNGFSAIEPPKEPRNAHPHPIFRVEKNISQLIELVDFTRNAIGVTMSRKDLVHLFHRGATAASFFWFSQHAKPEDIEQSFIIGGAINHPNMREYLPLILKAWDDIEPEIKSIKRFKLGLGVEAPSNLPDLGMLQFTEDFRSLYL
jgi:hypothetical protein